MSSSLLNTSTQTMNLSCFSTRSGGGGGGRDENNRGGYRGVGTGGGGRGSGGRGGNNNNNNRPLGNDNNNPNTTLTDMLRRMKPLSNQAKGGGRGGNSSTYRKSGFRGPSSAVSIFHGDYKDDEDDYDEDTGIGGEEPFPEHDAEHEWKKVRGMDIKEEVDEDEENKERNAMLAELTDAMHEQKLVWKERSQPVVRYQELDNRGRAYGRGGRKTASARVWIFPGEGNVTVNRADFVDYFTRESHREMILSPLVATKSAGLFDVVCQVEGGGLTGKAGAIRHGLARALEKFNPEFRTPMKLLGMMTRDSRKVERKKYGLKKARKATQWVKR